MVKISNKDPRWNLEENKPSPNKDRHSEEKMGKPDTNLTRQALAWNHQDNIT